MILGSSVVWLAFSLLIVGFSFARMGPSFSRNKFSYPVIISAILILIINNYPIDNPEIFLMDYLDSFAPWFFVCTLGCFLVLSGSPVYWKTSYPKLIPGWIIILVSFILLFEYNDFPENFLLIGLPSLFGSILSVILFVYLVRFVEGRIPLEDPAPELTEEEMKFVTKIISKNIGVGEE